MEDRQFDDVARTFASQPTRRSLLKGLLGFGGAAAAAVAPRQQAGAAWSTEVCLPAGSGYTRRLVPTAAVPFYVQRYGAVIPSTCADYGDECGELPDGCGGTITCECPSVDCPPFYVPWGNTCLNPCTPCLDTCQNCATLPNGEAFCMDGEWEWSCDSTCQQQDSVCGSALCIRILQNIAGFYQPVCDANMEVGFCVTKEGQRGVSCGPSSS